MTRPTRRTGSSGRPDRLQRRAIHETLAGQHLDAIIAATNSPAWVTTLGKGDAFSVGSSSRRRWPATRTSRCRPGSPAAAGRAVVHRLRLGEANLIKLAYAFEKGTQVRQPPKFIPTIGG